MQVTDDMWYLFNLKHRKSAGLMPLFQQELIDFIDEKVCQAIGLENKEGVADTIACVNWVTANRSKLHWLEADSSDAMPEQKLRPLSCFITFESIKAKTEAKNLFKEPNEDTVFTDVVLVPCRSPHSIIWENLGVSELR